MEKEPKKPESVEDDDDSSDDKDVSQSKVSKKSDLSSKRASFFTAESSKEKLVIEEAADTEHDDSKELEELSENEVHEAVLVVVDTRLQQISEELEQAQSDSLEEFEAVSSAVFLEALASRANGQEDFTPNDIKEAHQEALEDITLDGSDAPETKPGDGGAEPPDGTLPPEDSSSERHEPEEEREHPGLEAVPSLTTTDSYAAPDISQKEAPDEYEAYIPRSDMLLGVVVGYIIGHRGGRIRTEKRLKPEIKKLENQVAELCNMIVEKEKLIRKQSQEIYEQSFDKIDKTQAVIERRKVREQIKEQLARREELAQDPNVEKIGKFSLPALKVFHERRLPDGSENSPSRKSVEAMTVSELLEKVGNLEIDGLHVSKMFHKNRLSEKALRRIVKEYLRGGEYRKTFYRELGPDLEHLESKRQELAEVHATEQIMTKETFNLTEEIQAGIGSGASNQDHSPQLRQRKIQNDKKAAKWPVVVGVAVAILIIYSLLS